MTITPSWSCAHDHFSISEHHSWRADYGEIMSCFNPCSICTYHRLSVHQLFHLISLLTHPFSFIILFIVPKLANLGVRLSAVSSHPCSLFFCTSSPQSPSCKLQLRERLPEITVLHVIWPFFWMGSFNKYSSTTAIRILVTIWMRSSETLKVQGKLSSLWCQGWDQLWWG